MGIEDGPKCPELSLCANDPASSQVEESLSAWNPTISPFASECVPTSTPFRPLLPSARRKTPGFLPGSLPPRRLPCVFLAEFYSLPLALAVPCLATCSCVPLTQNKNHVVFPSDRSHKTAALAFPSQPNVVCVSSPPLSFMRPPLSAPV